MSTAGNGHAQVPSTTVVLKLLPVPEKGPITVRFLGEMKATLTHYVPGKPKGHSEVCMGEDCPSNLHKLPRVWKGYAPAEVWRPVESDWYPGVVEITEALGQQFDGRKLTGELWELQRCKGVFKHPELVGVFLAVERPAPVDCSKWVDTVCFRLYRTTEIIWGATDPLPNRVRIETRKAPPPPTIPTHQPEVQAHNLPPSKTFAEMRKAARL
jgi:hypothetical protein